MTLTKKVVRRPLGDPPTRGSVGRAYDEGALRYLLAVERSRAHRANRALLVMLVSLRPQHGLGPRLDRDQGDRIVAALSACVREVDFVGWFRQGRVVAAVLAQNTELPDRSAVDRIADGMKRLLQNDDGPSITDRLRLRVLHVAPPRMAARS